MRHRAVRAFRRELDGRLRAAAPALAWPPHANRLSIPAVLAEAVARGCERPAPGAREAHHHALQSTQPAPLAWREALDQGHGRETPREVLQAMDGWLAQENPALWRTLQVHLRSLEGRLVDLLAAVRGIVAANVDSAPARCDPPERHTDRYLRVFLGLVERVFLLMEQGDQLVIIAARYGRRSSGTLQTADLHAAMAGLEGRYRGRVVGLAEPVQYYDAEVDPGVVLADLVVNRLHGLVRGSLPEVLSKVATTLQIPAAMRSGIAPHAGELPALVAEGEPRVALAQALRGEAPTLSAHLCDDWARQQAEAWIRALSTPEGP